MIDIKITGPGTLALPAYQTEGSSGMDVRAFITEPMEVKSLERVAVPTGLIMAIPVGYEIQVRPRSGLAKNHGITVLNAPGTIDSDYRGEVMILLVNLSAQTYSLQPGERIAQFVLAKTERANWQLSDNLDVTTRAEGGFGSTGK